jgi:hypothetical protein
MTSTEDRLRDAFRADAQTIQPDTIRPRASLADVTEPAAGPRAGGSWSAGPRRRLLIPLSAAAAVLAIVLAVALVSSGRSAVGPVAGPRPGAPGGPVQPAPPFFVGLLNNGLGVYNAETGRRIAVITPPARGVWFHAAAATSNDRVFIVATSHKNSTPCYISLYRLTLTSAGRLAGLAPLAVPRVAGSLQNDTGLTASPSGQFIGFAANDCAKAHSQAGLINLASGQVRRWPATTETLLDLSISPGGQTLFFDNPLNYGGDGTIRALAASARPGPLLRQARIVLPASSGVDQTGSAAVAGRGKILLGCRETRGVAVLTSYAAATGRELAVVHTWRHAGDAGCMISVTPSGGYVLAANVGHGLGSRLDLYTGRATPIAGGPDQPAGIAW